MESLPGCRRAQVPIRTRTARVALLTRVHELAPSRHRWHRSLLAGPQRLERKARQPGVLGEGDDELVQVRALGFERGELRANELEQVAVVG
eukprot:CAMPEP_0179982746 /NCGR_PEP_ID=MMETSP0984-20121128/131_1 /TAXON_ID=483367 /ORGANISM="non described non described, Strain CCMP 2436" /LENGTH=90 /DNA_ID=CAMNT_0021901021 /DNA_START=146 /DNA_END=414 /DNA_ORIENTATION=+